MTDLKQYCGLAYKLNAGRRIVNGPDFRQTHDLSLRETEVCYQIIKAHLAMMEKPKMEKLRERILDRDEQIAHLEAQIDEKNGIIKDLLREMKTRPVVLV